MGRAFQGYIMPYAKTILSLCAAATLTLVNVTAAEAPALVTVTNKQGAVELVMLAEPAQIRLDRDVLLTIRVRAPENITVRLPDITPRLTGFILAGTFSNPESVTDGLREQEYCYRLTPLVNDEYRLGPLAVAYTITGGDPATPEWLITRPLVLLPPTVDTPKVADIRGPRWIMPSWRLLPILLGVAVVIVVGAWLVWRLIQRLLLLRRLRRMSPRRRALYELEQLLLSGLLAAGRQKDFFTALSLIVRRYIERAHAIRAPEQTTEEFLLTVAADARFDSAVQAKLSEFLKNSDLVKFATWRPDAQVAERAVNTAREYIETDGAASTSAPEIN